MHEGIERSSNLLLLLLSLSSYFRGGGVRRGWGEGGVSSEALVVFAYPVIFSLVVFCSFYDKKKFSSKKEQKTIDASEKVCILAYCFTTAAAW